MLTLQRAIDPWRANKHRPHTIADRQVSQPELRTIETILEDEMNKNLVLLVLSAFLLMEVACAFKTEQGDIGKKSSTDADNTARNSRDRDGATQTSGDQAENETDRQITAAVRQAVVGDSSLSTNAHNVKIVTSGGTVRVARPSQKHRGKGSY